MGSKIKNLEILSEKIKDKDFKFELNAAKLVFPIHTSLLEDKHIYFCSIEHARNIGKITTEQAKSYKQNLKNHLNNGTDYFQLYDKITPIYDYGIDSYVRLGDLQQFFINDYSWGCGIFDTKETLINSFEYFMRYNDNLSTDVDKFFKYLPYLKSVLKDCPLEPTTYYCCEDCDGEYSSFISNSYQHLADMCKITLEHKIK